MSDANHASNGDIQQKNNNVVETEGSAKNGGKAKKERKKKRKTSQRSTKNQEDFNRPTTRQSWKSDGSMKHVDNITDTTVRIEKKEVKEENEVKKTVIDTVNIHSTRTTFTEPNGNQTKNQTNVVKTEEVNVKPNLERVKVIKRMTVGGYEKCPCILCTKHIYPMELVFAEKNNYHKTCFRCVNCRKLLGLDNYKMFEEQLYCPNHYRQQVIQKMKAEEDVEPPPTKKHEMIIRENIPAQLHPDVVRCNDKAEDEIDHISLSKKLRNIKSRLEASMEEETSPSTHLAVKETPLQRSPSSIMDRLAKYQAATSKRQVSDSDSESSDDSAERNPDVIKETKAKDQVKFTRMNSLMSKWESGSVKNELLPTIKNDIADDLIIQETLNGDIKANEMKKKFEAGSVDENLDLEKAEKMKREKERDLSVFRHTDDDTVIETGAIGQKFKFFESYDDSPSVARKRFQMTPPREGDKSSSSDDENDPHEVHSSYSSRGDLPRSNTTSKMLNKFKEMESKSKHSDPPKKRPIKPIRKITPPKEHSDISENDELSFLESEDDDKSTGNKTAERIKVEPEKAKNLRNKFENWENKNNKENIRRSTNLCSSLTCSNLRAKFETVKDETPAPKGKPPPKINRFAAYQANISEQDKCAKCSKRVYALEKIGVNKLVLHKTCFKCSVCSCFLSMNSYTTLKNVLYCTTHFKQLFAVKGNYDEGFGREQYKDKWSKTSNGHSENDVNDISNGHSEPIENNSHVEPKEEPMPSDPPVNDHTTTNGFASVPITTNDEGDEKQIDSLEPCKVEVDESIDASSDGVSSSDEPLSEDESKPENDESVNNEEEATDESNIEEMSVSDNEKLTNIPSTEHEDTTSPPTTTTCVKVATSIHGYNNDIYEMSSTRQNSQDDLLYENVTMLKQNDIFKELDGESKKSDMDRSFASDDSLENYLKDSVEIEGFDVDAYLREGVGMGLKREDSENELISH